MPRIKRLGIIAALFALGAGAAPGFALSSLGEESSAPVRCPYDFRSEMPAGEFCVYRGVITSEDGSVCVDDAVVIWSSHDGVAPRDERGHDVFFGFLDPPLVIHAVAPARRRARLVNYSPTDDRLETPLDGLTTVEPGSLTIQLNGSFDVGSGSAGCEFDSYRGVFVGLMQTPEENAAIDVE